MSDNRESEPTKPEWAGKGHMLGCLIQTGILLLINLAVWGFVFIFAVKQSSVPITDVLPWWPF